MDAALLSAGISAALAAASFVGGKATPSRGKGRQGRKSQIKRSKPSTGLGGYQSVNRSDLTVKPPSNLNVPRSVPRNVAALIAWDTVKINGSNTFTTTILEQNFIFSMSQHPQSSSWLTLFDQYTIPQVTIEWDSTLAPGATTSSPMLYTALDFDNATNLGSIQRLEDYTTSEAHPMNPQHRFMRSVRPVPKSLISTASGNSPAGIAGPSWIDSGEPTAQFFGIRSILGIGTGSFNTTITIWYAFRNQI
jgi:hypothetical protein